MKNDLGVSLGSVCFFIGSLEVLTTLIKCIVRMIADE